MLAEYDVIGVHDNKKLSTTKCRELIYDDIKKKKQDEAEW